MRSIGPEEIIGNAVLKQGPAPKHTYPGHERCAYYQDLDHPVVWCIHEIQVLGGALYSEDYVRELESTIGSIREGVGDALGSISRAGIEEGQPGPYEEGVG